MSFYKALPNAAALDRVHSHWLTVANDLDALTAEVADMEDHREFHRQIKHAATLAREIASSSTTLIRLVNKALELGAELQNRCQGCGGTKKTPGSLADCPWCTIATFTKCPKCGHSFTVRSDFDGPSRAEVLENAVCPRCRA